MAANPLWRELISAWKARMMARQRGRCLLCNGLFVEYCGFNRNHPLLATVEHIVPLSCGGGHEDENIALSHAECNHRRGNSRAIPYLNDIAIDGETRLISELRRLIGRGLGGGR